VHGDVGLAIQPGHRPALELLTLGGRRVVRGVDNDTVKSVVNEADSVASLLGKPRPKLLPVNAKAEIGKSTRSRFPFVQAELEVPVVDEDANSSDRAWAW
jgi:hypothetical protein